MIPKTGTEWGWFILTAFVLAIGINLISSYLKPVTDRWLGRFSDYRRISNEKERKRVDDMVQWMLDNPAAVAIVSGSMTRAMISTFGFLTLMITCLVMLGLGTFGRSLGVEIDTLSEVIGISLVYPYLFIRFVNFVWIVFLTGIGFWVVMSSTVVPFYGRCLRRYKFLDRERRKSPAESTAENE